MLTLQGYRVEKKNISNLSRQKTMLTAKPYIPSVFVKPQYVQKYPLYTETERYLIVPKHYGIQEFGQPTESLRNVSETPALYWEFAGTLRPIQKNVVATYLQPTPRDGILCLQTGGGKTVCALYIASQLRMPTIILVHNTFLKDQWVDRIKSFLPKARIGIVQEKTIDVEEKDVVIAMLQSISMKTYSEKTFEKFGLVIVDECHHIASETFCKAIPKLTSKHMLGLSATPERKDKLMHVINWCLGPLLYTSDTSDKIDEKVKVEVYEFEPKDSEYNNIIYNNSGVMFTSLMINKVVKYDERNTLIKDILTDLFDDTDKQILVLSDRVDHTTILFDKLDKTIQDVSCVLSRKATSAQREEWFLSKRIFIATYSMCKEGFDLEKLNTLIIATPRPDVDQIVGRILRTDKMSRKIHPLIIDIVDPAFRRQFQERLSLYKKRNYKIEKMTLV